MCEVRGTEMKRVILIQELIKSIGHPTTHGWPSTNSNIIHLSFNDNHKINTSLQNTIYREATEFHRIIYNLTEARSCNKCHLLLDNIFDCKVFVLSPLFHSHVETYQLVEVIDGSVDVGLKQCPRHHLLVDENVDW